MKSLFEPRAPETLISRIDTLTAQSQPLWGKMNVAQMMVHCTIPLKMALGEVTLIYMLPTPKSVPTHPELRDPVTTEWQKDRDDFKSTLLRFAKSDPAKPLAEHASFGDMSRSQWGRLSYKHIDHHLRQFGA